MLQALRHWFLQSRAATADSLVAAELADAIELSDSGKLSVSFEAVARTKRFQDDLEILRRIAQAHQH